MNAHRPALLLATLGLLACRNAAPEPPPPPPPPLDMSGHPAPMNNPHGNPPPSSGTLHWTDPTSWHRGTPSSSMRRAQYVIPASDPNAEGELAVFWFGAGQGGSIESNLTRWYGQFEQPDGRPTASVATRETRTSHGLNVTVTRVEGRFNGGMMPGAPAPTAHEGYALLAAIVETPNGPWFFKMTGPRTTVAAATPSFDELVRSFEFR